MSLQAFLIHFTFKVLDTGISLDLFHMKSPDFQSSALVSHKLPLLKLHHHHHHNSTSQTDENAVTPPDSPGVCSTFYSTIPWMAQQSTNGLVQWDLFGVYQSIEPSTCTFEMTVCIVQFTQVS